MNLSIRPQLARPQNVSMNLASRAIAPRILHPAGLPAGDLLGSISNLRAPVSPDSIGGTPPDFPTGTPTQATGAGKTAAKESKGFFGKIGGFFKKVGGFFKTIGTRMGRGIRDGLKELVWNPLKKHVFAPIKQHIVDGAKHIGSFIKKHWPF